jgi:hypothetical protein
MQKTCSTWYTYLPECFKEVDVKRGCSCDTKHVLLLGPKKYETLYFSVSLSQRSITYASLEDVRGMGEWWRATEQSYYTAVARV